jgi:hypothetical protein
MQNYGVCNIKILKKGERITEIVVGYFIEKKETKKKMECNNVEMTKALKEIKDTRVRKKFPFTENNHEILWAYCD